MSPRKLDRRDFLGRLALGGAAVPLASHLAGCWVGVEGESSLEIPIADGPRAAMKQRAWKQAVKFGMIGEGGTLLQKFQLVADLGFDGLEIDSPSDLDLDEVRAARDATGLEIPGVVDSVHWKDTLSHPDPRVRARGLAGLMTAIEDCKAVGGSTVLLVPAVVRGEETYEQAWDRSIIEVKKAIPRAEELGVQIAFENVWNNFITDADEAVRYVDAFESETVGWYFDVGNIVRFQDPAAWAEKLGQRVLKLDVKGYSLALAEKDGHGAGFRAEIGDGDGSWAEVMARLDAAGVCTWATAEVGGGGRKRLADVKARMDRVLGA